MSRRGFAVALVVLLFATAGCGARWSRAQKASVTSRDRGGALAQAGDQATGEAAAAAGDAGTPGSAGSAASTGGAGGSTAGGAAAARGSQAAGGASTAAAAALACRAPATAPGVTNDTLTLGSIASLTGPVPGLGASAQAGARAYVAFRNSTGGVCGRKVMLKTADDTSDNGQNRATTSQLAPQVLGLVGGFGAGDAGSADIVTSQKIPVVTVAVSDQYQNAPTVFDMNPPFANVHAVIGKYKYLADQGVRKAAIIYFANDQSRSEILAKQRPQMEAAGIQIVNQQELPLSTLSYDPAARAVVNSGADYLLFLGASSQDASMARSMTDTGYKLKSAEYLTAYGSNFIDIAGSGGEGAVSWIRNVPNEEPNSNAEQAAFLKWMAQTASDQPADTFAADSWAGAKAFFDALEGLKGPISRDAVIAQLKTFTRYDAGGFEGAINLGGKVTNGCFIAMKVTSGKWKRLAPERGFLC